MAPGLGSNTTASITARVDGVSDYRRVKKWGAEEINSQLHGGEHSHNFQISTYKLILV